MTVRTRIAPSPTGYVHVASLRNALYCYCYAKKHNGQFVIRVEDTDQNRIVEGAVEEVFEMFHEYGMVEDESIQKSGPFGPYIQSQRKEIYQEYALKLIESGHAYYCFLEGDELVSIQKEFRGRGFRSPFRDTKKEDALKLIKEGKKYVIRLRVPENEKIEFVDGVQGKTVFDTNIVGDEILIKSNGMASYHLAVVIDDFLMQISHVLRSVEWYSSTPKQILIYKFLGLKMPLFFHPPVILDPAGGKLSKRKGTVSLRDFLKEGYLPEAVNNFVMLLGWSPQIERVHGEKEREIFGMDEMIKLFDLTDINQSNALFNREKLLWFNQEYIKSYNSKELAKVLLRWIEKFAVDKSIHKYLLDDFILENKLELVKTRSKTLVELISSLKFFYEKPQNVDFGITQLNAIKDNITKIIERILKLHESLNENATKWTHQEWEAGMRKIAEDFSVKAGDVFMALRIAIVGSPYSPPLFEALQILGKSEVLIRIKNAINL